MRPAFSRGSHICYSHFIDRVEERAALPPLATEQIGATWEPGYKTY
jgi:hypothetical protein